MYRTLSVCLCVAEEDEFNSYSRTLLQYFLAEGVMSGHELFVASAQDHPDDIIKVITLCVWSWFLFNKTYKIGAVVRHLVVELVIHPSRDMQSQILGLINGTVSVEVAIVFQ